MAYEQRDNEGSLFKNDRRREGKQDSHARGSAMIDGIEYWVDAWTNDGQRGKWQKLKFRRKDDSRTPSEAQHGSDAPDFSDEIPF